MKKLLSFLLVFLSLVRVCPATPGMIIGPASTLLTMAWDEINPGSLKNQVAEISRQLGNMKTQLGRIEQAVIFGKDIKTLEYLITKYSNIDDTDEMQKKDWSDMALEYGSDGFSKTTKSLEELMEGTSKIFASTSIFENIASNDKEGICNNVNFAFDYLTGLWITSHVVWSQAYKFKNNDYSKNAKELKARAESKMEDFEQVKEAAMPDECYWDCLKEDLFYANVDHLINPSATVSVNATSASACQYKCYVDNQCKVWTFHKNSFMCFKHNNDNNAVEAGLEVKGEVVSGPKVCPPAPYSFCCGLDYKLSVFVTIHILFTIILIICICIMCGSMKCRTQKKSKFDL